MAILPIMRAAAGGAASLLLIALATPSASAGPTAWSVDCRGQLKVDDVFDGGRPELLSREWRLIVNPLAGYVKRPPELAAGCMEKQVEVCGCEQSEAGARCRSLGIAADGTEIAMDFTLDRRAGVLRASGHRHRPASGHMTEMSGEFACQAAATP